MRRARGVLVGAAVVALAAAVTAFAAGSKTFTDPSGDSGAAPDITTVVVSNDDKGQLTFAITLANPAALTGEAFVVVALNSDKNQSTGTMGDGSDYALYLDATSQVLLRWNGTTFAPMTAASLTRSGANTIGINRNDIGGSGIASFTFYVVSFGPGGVQDDAPNGTAVWTYDLEFRPELDSVNATFQPGTPRAGKVFAVSRAVLRLKGGRLVQPSSFTCRARLGVQALAPSGRCRWSIPKNAKGKKLVIAITATYQGVSATFQAYNFTVR